jgi:Na+/serine symporter
LAYERKVPYEEARQLCLELSGVAAFFEVSSAINTNVSSAFDTVIN